MMVGKGYDGDEQGGVDGCYGGDGGVQGEKIDQECCFGSDGGRGEGSEETVWAWWWWMNKVVLMVMIDGFWSRKGDNGW